jgi:glycerophosphoryl diester phosphodiesterase
LDHPGPIPFAHRGGASDWPENTMPAFEAAVGLGYRYLETDVQATADGVLAAFHDDDLTRTCGRPGRISELAWSEVRTARVGGLEPIPLLTDLLEAFPDARLNIDCKSDASVQPLVDVLRRTNSLERVCLGTFSHRRLVRLRRLLGPGLCTSMSPREVAQWLAGRLPAAPAAAQVPPTRGRLTVVSRRTVARAARRGVPVHVWTIDDPAEMHRLLDLGVAGIMTDRPAVLRDVLRSRGQWVG